MTEQQQRRAAFHKATGRIATSEMEMYFAYCQGIKDGAAAMKERAAKVCFDWGEASGVHLSATIRALGDDDE